MVAPVTGPFLKTSGSAGSPVYRSQRIWRQAKPITLPLPYEGYGHRNTLNTRPGYYASQSEMFGTFIPNTQAGYQFAINDCASKLRSKVSDGALWAVNLAEQKQSVQMITERLLQLSRLARAILKRDERLLITALGRNTRGGLSWRNLTKGAADLWLEFSFGWKPLVQDIYSAIDVLQQPIKATTVSARKTYGAARTSGSQGVAGQFFTWKQYTGTDFCQMGCQVTINNPNLYLANNLGLANPALVIWELVPFSFVVDWFVSVGQFLESGTAWLGLTVTNPYTSYGSKGVFFKQDGNPFDSPQVWSSAANAFWMTRRTSILESAIIVRPQKIWGWQRAANAAAVLTQLLHRF